MSLKILHDLIREYISDEVQSVPSKVQLEECVVATRKFDGDRILLKNRDRNYRQRLKVVRDVIEGIEIVYIQDVETDWSEGMNEKGIGIINSALLVTNDEKDREKARQGKKSYDGGKIRKALAQNTLEDAIESVVTFTGDDNPEIDTRKSRNRKPTTLNGHTIVADPNEAFHVESVSFRDPVIKHIKDDTFVETNHGDEIAGVGYSPTRKPKDYKSSVTRKRLATNRIKSVKNPIEALEKLGAKPKGLKGYLNPYRYDYKLYTGAQIMMNLNQLEFTLLIDPDITDFLGIDDRTPKSHDEKIKIVIIENPDKD